MAKTFCLILFLPNSKTELFSRCQFTENIFLRCAKIHRMFWELRRHNGHHNHIVINESSCIVSVVFGQLENNWLYLVWRGQLENIFSCCFNFCKNILYISSFSTKHAPEVIFILFQGCFTPGYSTWKDDVKRCMNEIQTRLEGVKNKGKQCRYLPLRVEILHYSSEIIIVLLPLFPLILSHQCISGNCGHANALCKQVCPSAWQHDVGCLKCSMAADM